MKSRGRAIALAVMGTMIAVAATAFPAAGVQAASAPGAPTAVRATVSGASATLVWAPPTSNGGSVITGYRLSRDGVDTQGTGAWSGTVSASSSSATFGLLQASSVYQLSVQAINTAGTGPATTVKVLPSTAGTTMPTGNLTGWQQKFTEDFTTSVALGSWPGSYSSKWADYTGGPDTSGQGYWNAQTTVSVANGQADYYLHSVGGVPQSAAILPKTTPQTYGRYSVRFKVDSGLAGWASAWLLWPNDEVWPAHGEIDWPEGKLDGKMQAFMHYANAAGGQDSFGTQVPFASDWHTATTEWTAGAVKYYLDGQLIGTATNQVPSTPMHWVLQTETAYGTKPTTSGHVKIDWAVIYERV